MAGVPLLNGFLSKEMFFAETLTARRRAELVDVAAAVAMGIFSVTYSLRFISVFFGSPPRTCRTMPHEPPRWMRFPVEFLVLVCLVVGIAPAERRTLPATAAVASVLGDRTPAYDLAVWHGFNLPLLMSFVALGGGIASLHRAAQVLRPGASDQAPVLHRFKRAQAYETTMLRVSAAASWLVQVARHPAPAAATAADDGGAARRCRCSWWPAARARFRARMADIDPLFAGAVADRLRLRARGRVAGQVPPAGRADPGRRHRHRHQHDLPVAVRARPGADPVDGGDRDHGADPARVCAGCRRASCRAS